MSRRINVQHHELGTAAPSEKRDKIKYSNFFVTINTNARDQNPEGMVRQWVPAIRSGFDPKVLEKAIFFVEKQVVGQTKDDPPKPITKMVRSNMDHWKFVDNVDVQTRPEIGSAKGLVHMHALIKIRHTTAVQIDWDVIKDEIRSNGGDWSYFNYKIFRDASKTFEDYLNKTAESAPQKRSAKDPEGSVSNNNKSSGTLARVSLY